MTSAITLKMTNRQVLNALEALAQVKATMGFMSEHLELLRNGLRDHLAPEPRQP